MLVRFHTKSNSKNATETTHTVDKTINPNSRLTWKLSEQASIAKRAIQSEIALCLMPLIKR